MIQNDFLHIYMSHLDPPNLYLWSQNILQSQEKVTEKYHFYLQYDRDKYLLLPNPDLAKL